MKQLMRPLWLDYQRPARSSQGAGVAVLLLGLLVCGGLFDQFSSLNAERAVVEQQLDRLKRDDERRRLMARSDPSLASGEAQAPGAISLSAARWEALFSALERSADESVTLLGLEPGPKEIKIVGEARDKGATLDYVQRLNAESIFAGTRLAQQETVKDHPQRPVRFSLIALWRGGVQ